MLSSNEIYKTQVLWNIQINNFRPFNFLQD